MKERQSERKEEVLFRCTDSKHTLVLLSIFFLSLFSLSPGGFCFFFSHLLRRIRFAYFAVCNRTTSHKKQVI